MFQQSAETALSKKIPTPLKVINSQTGVYSIIERKYLKIEAMGKCGSKRKQRKKTKKKENQGTVSELKVHLFTVIPS